jgi:ABC-type nitrate/sulfonate/bicarbonate transport system substrate-binding protein
MSEEYIEQHPDAPKIFLKAFIEAYYYFATHKSQANVWFKRDSQLTFDEAVLDLAASVEPNVQAKSIRDIDLDLQPQLVSKIQEGADFVFEQGLTAEHVQVAEHIDLSYLHQALAEMNLDNYDPSCVRVKTL